MNIISSECDIQVHDMPHVCLNTGGRILKVLRCEMFLDAETEIGFTE